MKSFQVEILPWTSRCVCALWWDARAGCRAQETSMKALSRQRSRVRVAHRDLQIASWSGWSSLLCLCYKNALVSGHASRLEKPHCERPRNSAWQTTPEGNTSPCRPCAGSCSSSKLIVSAFGNKGPSPIFIVLGHETSKFAKADFIDLGAIRVH